MRSRQPAGPLGARRRAPLRRRRLVVWLVALLAVGCSSRGGGGPDRTPGPPAATSGVAAGAAAPGPGTPAPRPAPNSGGPTRPAAPAPSDGPPGQRSFSLVATGDVLLHGPLWEQARRDAAAAAPGTGAGAGAGAAPAGTAGSGAAPLDFTAVLSGVQPRVAAADVAICHLETPLAAAGGPYRDYPQFAVPPQIVPALRATGYDACTTASNHSYDQGAAGIDRTLDALDAAGVAHAGTARSLEEADRTTLLTVQTSAGPVRLALLSYTFGFNGVAAPGGQAWRAHTIDEAAILRDAAAAKRAGAEVTVVALHWGDEYRQVPSAQQLALAPRLAAAPGIDLLLGHHSHVAEPMQQIGGTWVVYGLGNLVSAHRTRGEPLREGVLARFVFREQPDGRFRVGEAGYAPLLVTDTPPLRVLDVATALRGGGAPNASPERLSAAQSRTAAVVGSRGAVAAGLAPLGPP